MQGRGGQIRYESKQESLTLQQDHEGNPILDTAPKRTTKEGMQDIGMIGDETWVLNNLTQTSKTLKRTAPSHEMAVLGVCSEAEPYEFRVGLFEIMQAEGNG